MKKAIVEFIKTRGGGVSFVELHKEIPEFAGDLSIQIPDHNILLWQGVSQRGIDAITDLVKREVITCKRTAPLTYAIDGYMVDMPIATSMNRKYKHMRWLPVTFSVN